MVAAVYALHLPSASEYRYVGRSKTVETRLQIHYARARRQAQTPLQHWLLEHANVVLSVLETVEHEDQLDARERHWIAVLREQGHSLLNVTPGGLGGYTLGGRPVRAEVAAKISKTKTGVSLSEDHVKRAVAGRTQHPQSCISCQRLFKNLGAFRAHYGSVHKDGNQKRAAKMREAWAAGRYDNAHRKLED